MANTTSMVNTDPYAMKLKSEFGNVVMTSFPDLKKEDIDAILDWADKYENPERHLTGPGVHRVQRGSDNSILYGLLTLILAVIGLSFTGKQ